MSHTKDRKWTPTFRTGRRKGLYMDLPPRRHGVRWGRVIGIFLAIAVPAALIVWLIRTLAG